MTSRSSTPPTSTTTTTTTMTQPLVSIDLKQLIDNLIHSAVKCDIATNVNKDAIKESMEKALPLFDKTKMTEPQQVEWRSNVEIPLRQSLGQLFKSDQTSIQQIDNLIQFIIYLFELGYIDTMLVYLLEDMFDSNSISRSIQLFALLESRVEFFSQDALVSSTSKSKLVIIKICVELLRRLSKSTNPESCGRVLIFLAYLFPLSDPSGLNSKSVNNLRPDDLIRGDSLIDGGDVAMQVDSSISDTTTVDMNFYKQFWALQSYFQNPYQLITNGPASGFVSGNAATLNKERWTHFTQSIDLVLTTFATHINLDELASLPKDHYFTKYLTNSNLMKLQLKDSIFRRNILTQLLFTFQFLDVTSHKNPTLFTDEHKQSIQNQSIKAIKILSQTQPNGNQFAECLNMVLKRETNWIAWKRDQSCKSFEKPSCPPIVVKRRKVKKHDPSKVSLGNAELSRLWNISNDNHEFLKQETKLSLDTYLMPLRSEKVRLDEEARAEAEKKERRKQKEIKRHEEHEKRQQDLAEKKRKNPEYEPTEEDEDPIEVDSDDLEDLDEPQPLLKDDQMYIWKTLRLMSRQRLECFKASDSKLNVDNIVQAYFQKAVQSPKMSKGSVSGNNNQMIIDKPLSAPPPPTSSV
ncbi:hypothetical protein SAMD00019534_122770 [Acytostelium subglobosum LB1]|uniref:hypothetical protein n=1 Tax=Acytostelium subglobosum LB1 TaxID=1410327 RepID=UPI000644DF0A|nr:hypothetical protein SAMD00019534_122770 [Acytostelium subglobosum LB1]GAM29101.1 hypothetical protein SAMD00019534_122770 [Acytostelium subglobosum LB1]|eukprot:XP_012747946.1 hypothetical protein SAMD00019534_122770 [Acytostelium subglobosum LB1]